MHGLRQVRAEGAPESWDWVPKGAVSSVKAQVRGIWVSRCPGVMVAKYLSVLVSWCHGIQVSWCPGAKVEAASQEQCGSCAAFAAVAVIESCFWQQRNQTMFDDLSEQHVVSWHPDGLSLYPLESSWTAPITTISTTMRGPGAASAATVAGLLVFKPLHKVIPLTLVHLKPSPRLICLPQLTWTGL